MEGLSAIIGRLVSGGVEFVVVGGYAAVAYGASLMTRDVDVCCPFTPENLGRLVAALAGLHARHRLTPQRLPFDSSGNALIGLRNLYLETDLGILDCLSEVAGVGGFDEVARSSVEVQLPAGKCRVLGLEALISAKQAMGRPHDLITVVQLLAIREQANPLPPIDPAGVDS